jgi:transcriptional antiterminator RfaH
VREDPLRPWNVLYTKPHREEMVCSWLSDRGMRVYLPEVRSRSKAHKDRMEPFFPCYVFAQLDLQRQDLTSVGWTPGLRRVVSFGGTPATVGDAFIQFISERLQEINRQGWPLPFKPGDRVVIIEGPFRDMIGIFARPSSAARRVYILLDVLGKQTRCEVDQEWLKKL